MTNKLSELSLLVNDLNPDIIGISEVLPKNHTRYIYPEEFKLKGYNDIIHKNVAENKSRGSILYIKDDINFKEIKFENTAGIFEEGLFIELKVNKCESLLIASLYRRGESSDENNENLLNLFNDISKSTFDNILIMGDLNIKEIDWVNIASKNSDPQHFNCRFIECVRDCYLTQHVTENTRQRGSDTPSCLDLVFTNKEELINEVEQVAPLGKSDHSILKFDLKLEVETPAPKIIVKYEQGNYEKINEILSQIDWVGEFNKYPDNVEKQWEFFKSKYCEAERLHVPRKNVKINGKAKKKFSVPLDRATLLKMKKKEQTMG